jgi:hypothetical protein
MLRVLLAAYLTKRPPWVQAVVFGPCVGLFVAAGAAANTRNPVISSVLLQVLAVAGISGGLFYLALRAQLHRRPTGSGSPAWVHVAYTGAWLLSAVAAVLALFGAGGFKVAVLAIMPIVLLTPPALIGIRALPAGPAHDRRAPPPQLLRPCRRPPIGRTASRSRADRASVVPGR